MKAKDVFRITMLGLIAFVQSIASSAKEEALDFDFHSFWEQLKANEQKRLILELEPELIPKMHEEEHEVFREVMRLAEEMGDQEAALSRIMEILTPESSSALHYFAANFYSAKEEQGKAIHHYLISIEKHPTFGLALKNLGLVLFQRGMYEEAIPFHSRAIDLGLGDSNTWGLLGLCEVNVKQNVAAENSFRRAILLDPEMKDWKLGLARALLSSQKYEEATAILQEILIEKPDDDVVLSVQADAFIALDRPTDAVGNYAVIHRLGKANSQILMQMAMIYLSKNLNELSTESAVASLSMEDPLEFERYAELVDQQVMRGNYTLAQQLITNIRAAKLTDHGEGEMVRYEVKMSLAQGSDDTLVPLLTQLVNKDPNDGESLIMLAETHSQKEEYEQADLYFAKAKEIVEFQAKAALAWAESYVDRQLFAEAIAELEFVVIHDSRPFIIKYLENVRRVHQTQAYQS